ncbi:hypothetical protein IF2G_00554 [Cordyceps javanica]|nr:hypothetical protein IF2G_00554 [Cordyceps javanica]
MQPRPILKIVKPKQAVVGSSFFFFCFSKTLSHPLATIQRPRSPTRSKHQKKAHTTHYPSMKDGLRLTSAILPTALSVRITRARLTPHSACQLASLPVYRLGTSPPAYLQSPHLSTYRLLCTDTCIEPCTLPTVSTWSPAFTKQSLNLSIIPASLDNQVEYVPFGAALRHLFAADPSRPKNPLQIRISQSRNVPPPEKGQKTAKITMIHQLDFDAVVPRGFMVPTQVRNYGSAGQRPTDHPPWSSSTLQKLPLYMKTLPSFQSRARARPLLHGH